MWNSTSLSWTGSTWKDTQWAQIVRVWSGLLCSREKTQTLLRCWARPGFGIWYSNTTKWILLVWQLCNWTLPCSQILQSVAMKPEECYGWKTGMLGDLDANWDICIMERNGLSFLSSISVIICPKLHLIFRMSIFGCLERKISCCSVLMGPGSQKVPLKLLGSQQTRRGL